MLNLQDEAKAYIESVLGVTTQLTPATPAVPFNIRDSYEIFELSLLMTKHSTLSMVLLVAKDGDDYPGIVKLRKHIDLVHAATRQVIAYVCRSLTVQHRRSLITHQVNFIQPGFQMFLPEIALDLRESFRQRREQSDVAALLPAAQAMLLSCLRAGKTGQACFTTSALLGDLDYSRVTLSKAVDQLTSLQVINPVKSELQWNTYAFSGSPAEVFQKARQYLRSPVKKKVGITRNTLPMAPGVFMAGESALASYDAGRPTAGGMGHDQESVQRHACTPGVRGQ